ncbi:MAG: serine/threonine protein kinase, partial [Phycisphaerales bacterium]|nr:serine/threonine protein kinase [Phycisphaerales bacterium]
MTDSIPTRVDDAATKRQVHRAASAGTRIGPYKVLDVLGEGGFGVVYLAEQTEPIRRRVAVKVIKLGMDSKQILARFEAERQALALMDHPNVARVLDAGITEDGRPYFVMEHVPGVSITEHCDRNRLSIDDRIELFISVCEAVQHAHQKGIIHRDIKPSNILVSVNDTNAAPKIIDFGVAKALSQRLSKDTIFTEQGQIIGTPEYMSPEQAEMTAQDIDTRSDIYALGVVLYELLTGTRPFDLERVALLELQRVIRDEEPPRPSTRLSSLGDASAASAKRRRIDPKALVRNLRGDLDWIVMKCIEKDRTRRYEAATGLAEDLRRHLNDEPVLAGPPSAAYRMTKFVRRNRGAVVATGIVSAGLLVSTVISIAFAISEAEQRGVADLRTREANAAREAERTAKEESQQRAEELQVRTDQLQQVADFQSDQLSAIVPELMGRRLREAIVDAAPDDVSEALRTTLEQINFTSIGLESLEANVFDPALDAITEQFEGQPVVQAQLRYALAATALQLGLTDFAATPMQQSLAARREALGDDHPETLMSINGMGALLRAEGRLAAAEPYLREALERRRRVLGDDHSDTLGSINNLGTMLQDQGRFDEAEPFCRAALEARRRIFGDDHPDTLRSLNNLGALLYRQGRYD